MILKFVDDIFIYSSSPRSLYLNPHAPDWITINDKYKKILDLIDGKNEDAVIYEYINSFYNEEKEILTKQMKSLLATSNIFKHNQTKNENKTELVEQKPKYIYLTLTDLCNLNCIYCYAAERKKQNNVTVEIWKKYLSDIIEFSGKPVFTFTGGEPLLVSYIFELADYINKKGCECILLTNGTLVDTETADKISQCFSEIKISLDTRDESISNELRGAGIVEKASNAFNLLSALKCNVQILSTVTKKTSQKLDLFSESFNNRVNFQPLYNSIGRARNNENIAIDGLQYYNALTENGKFSLLSQYRNSIHKYRNNPYKRCAMANEELSIDAEGNVFPCHLLHYESLYCGNLNKEKIADIYNNSNVLNKLRRINVDIIPKCKICVFRNICGGACRARVDIEKKGITGSDDFCIFEQKTILDALLYSYG